MKFDFLNFTLNNLGFCENKLVKSTHRIYITISVKNTRFPGH